MLRVSYPTFLCYFQIKINWGLRMNPLLIFLVITILFYAGTYIYIRRKFNIKISGFFYTPTNKIHKYGERFLLILFLMVGGIAIFGYSVPIEPPYWYTIPFMLWCIFSAFMEWKFDKDSKKYILSLLEFAFILILLLGLIHLYNP
ncbi:MAG: DUF4181 domain-containing protein [Dethiobacteria bacterium]|jgi:hypothetical protein